MPRHYKDTLLPLHTTASSATQLTTTTTPTLSAPQSTINPDDDTSTENGRVIATASAPQSTANPDDALTTENGQAATTPSAPQSTDNPDDASTTENGRATATPSAPQSTDNATTMENGQASTTPSISPPTVNFDDTTTAEIESAAAISVTIVATLAAIIVILVTIIAIIVIVVLLRRKASHAGTACEEIVYDEIPDATRRQELQKVTDIIQTGSNPAYDTPASHLPELNEYYSSMNPDQLNATGEGTSQLAAILTDRNLAYGTPASHLTTSSKEMELTQNYAYAPTNISVDPNECYSSVNPDQLKAAGKSTSQLATTEEHAYDYI